MTTTAKPRRKYDGPTSEETLVSDLISLMESSDLPPWRREWSGHQGEHRNLLSGHIYRGSNPILLELGSLLRGHALPLWLGAAEAKSHGWFPRKGSKAVRIIRPQLNKREDENPTTGETELRAWVSYKPVCVFNAADLTGGDEPSSEALAAAIASAVGNQSPASTEARVLAAETVLAAWPVQTTYGGARACYLPSVDQIRMPDRGDFTSPETFCATWAHEQAHSTGHTSRLDRNLTGSHGSQTYAREELVAELSSVLICYRLQISCNLSNHAAYLKDWASILKEGGPRTLFSVLSDARKAADLIAPEPISE
jgi:antirestriction protein ArdC